MATRRLKLFDLAESITCLSTDPLKEQLEQRIQLTQFEELASSLVNHLLHGEGPEPPTASRLWHFLHDRLARDILAQQAMNETSLAAAAFARRLSNFCSRLVALWKRAGQEVGWKEIFPAHRFESPRLSLPDCQSIDLAVPLHRIWRGPDGTLKISAVRLSDAGVDATGSVELAILLKIVKGAMPDSDVGAIFEFYLPERKEVAVALSDLERVFERVVLPTVRAFYRRTSDTKNDGEERPRIDVATEGAVQSAKAQGEIARKLVTPVVNLGVMNIRQQLWSALKLQELKAQVVGSLSAPQVIRYILQPGLRETPEHYRAAAENLQKALKLLYPPLVFEEKNGKVSIDLPRAMPRVVTLRTFLNEEGAPAPGHPLAFYLGVEVGHLPLLADLCSKESAHLIAGGSCGSGKSQFLRAVVGCLASCNTPGLIGFSLIDLGGGGFDCLGEHSLHLAGPVVQECEEALEILTGAASAIGERKALLTSEGGCSIWERWQNGLCDLRLEIISIDETLPLAARASPFSEEFERLAFKIITEGQQVGIHLLMATRGATPDEFPKSVLAKIPQRLVFQTATSSESRYFLGFDGAERLLGRGDFLFLRNGGLCRGQSLAVDDQQLTEILSKEDATF